MRITVGMYVGIFDNIIVGGGCRDNTYSVTERDESTYISVHRCTVTVHRCNRGLVTLSRQRRRNRGSWGHWRALRHLSRQDTRQSQVSQQNITSCRAISVSNVSTTSRCSITSKHLVATQSVVQLTTITTGFARELFITNNHFAPWISLGSVQQPLTKSIMTQSHHLYSKSKYTTRISWVWSIHIKQVLYHKTKK